MTDSFQAGGFTGWTPDSRYNYPQNVPDLTEAINDEIDRKKEDTKQFFEFLIKDNEDRQAPKSKEWEELTQFTKKGRETVDWLRERQEARELYDWFVNPTHTKSRHADYTTTDYLDEEADELHSDNYTASRALEFIDPEIANQLRSGNLSRFKQKQLLTLLLKDSEHFTTYAKDKVLIDFEDGRGMQYLSAANGAAQYSKGLQEINAIYLQEILKLGVSPKLLRKALGKEYLNRHQTAVNEYSESRNTAMIEDQETRRSEELISNIKLYGGKAVVNYIKTYGGFKGGNGPARDEAFTFIEQARKDGLLKGHHLEEVLDYIHTWNDGSTSSIRDKFSKQANSLIEINKNANIDEMRLWTQTQEANSKAFVKEKFDSHGDQPLTEEIVDSWIAEFRGDPRFGGLPIPSRFLNAYTEQDEDDAEIDKRLTAKYLKGQKIRREDLYGINNAEMLEKWLRRVSSEDDFSNEALAFIKAEATDFTQDETLEAGAGNPTWVAIVQQAEPYFHQIYRAERGTGQSHESALSTAREKTRIAIRDKAFNKFPIINKDEFAAKAIETTKRSLSKDTTLLLSKDPWMGEELHLKQGLKYYLTGKGSIPEYYYKFSLKNKPPFELLVTRLKATGLINEDGTVPERDNLTNIEDQNLLLNKPNHSRTYQVVENNNRDVEWMFKMLQEKPDKLKTKAELNIESIEDLIAHLRAEANKWNSLTAVDPNWLRLVEIDQETLDEYYTLIGGEGGSIPPYLRLENLTPGVAMALLEDTLIEQ
tara:strand:- start:4497 stop:6785 length:2289 start_codon:yes stop_codon:yes gene_type:complete